MLLVQPGRIPCNRKIIMSYLCKMEMSYWDIVVMSSLEGGHYGWRGHYQDES
jgi:hypothetical protein